MTYSTSDSSTPLDAPYYGASLPIAFRRFWKKYATFSGRASRSEYWWWALIAFLVGIVIQAIYVPSLLAATHRDGTMSFNAGLLISGLLALVWTVATIVPTLALSWRRLHDANLSGGFWFLALIPFVGGIIVLILTLLPSNSAGARFDAPGSGAARI